MADDQTTWRLNLDVADALSSVDSLGSKIDGLGSVEGLSGLVEQFKSVGFILGGVAAAVLALKESMDIVFDAEQINAINQQFEFLASNAGIAAGKLKEDLVDASHGLVSETDLLQAANKALVAMGDNAAHLGEIMDITRNVTKVMGGDMVANFEAINQAISTGTTRQLRHLGIIIDQQKAYRDYAKSIGVTVDALSQAGKQAAIMNAVLEKGQSTFEGQGEDVRKATNSWKEFKVAMSEIGEALTLVFDKILGGTIRAVTSSLASLAKTTKNITMATFGDDAQKASAQIWGLTETVKLSEENIAKLKAELSAPNINPAWAKMLGKELDDETKKVETLKDKITELKGVASAPKSGTSSVDGSGQVASQKADNDKVLAAQVKFESDMLKLRKARFTSEEAIMTTEAEVNRHFNEAKYLSNKEFDIQIDDVRKKLAAGQIAGQTQASQQIFMINQARAAKDKALEDDLYKFRVKAADNYLQKSTSMFDGITKAANKASVSASSDTQNSAAVGTAAVNSMKTNFASAFTALGDGSKNAGDAMKGFILNSLADIASSQAKVFLLQGFANPPLLAAAAGLFALSGVLRGAAGAAGASSGVSSGGGASGGVATPSAPQTVDTSLGTGPQVQQSQQQKSVTIQIQGHYFETDQTKTMITDLVRQSSDATDFKISSVGGGI